MKDLSSHDEVAKYLDDVADDEQPGFVCIYMNYYVGGDSQGVIDMLRIDK